MYLLSIIYVTDEHNSDQQKNAFNRYVTYVTQHVHLKVHCGVGNIDKILNRFRVNLLLISETLKILIFYLFFKCCNQVLHSFPLAFLTNSVGIVLSASKIISTKLRIGLFTIFIQVRKSGLWKTRVRQQRFFLPHSDSYDYDVGLGISK